MTTIEEVASVWDTRNPQMQTKLHKDGKIKAVAMHGRPGLQAIIEFPNAPPSEKLLYIFSFSQDEQTKKLIQIKIHFERHSKESSNTKAFYDFLDKISYNNRNYTFTAGKINHNYLYLKRIYALDSSAQEICEGMEELIKLTQKPISDFLAKKR